MPCFLGSGERLIVEEFNEQFAKKENKQMILAYKMKLTSESTMFSKFHLKLKHTKSWEDFKSELRNRFGKIGDGQNKILSKFTLTSHPKILGIYVWTFLLDYLDLPVDAFPMKIRLEKAYFFTRH